MGGELCWSEIIKYFKMWTDDYSPEIMKGNLELPIDTNSIPVAAIGPLQINGKHAQGKYLALFSTTEGVLMASINRGAKLLNECGGVTTHTSQKRMSRCPVFRTSSADEALALGNGSRARSLTSRRNTEKCMY